MKKRLFTIISILAIMTLTLVGCGSSDGESNFSLALDMAEDGHSCTITLNDADKDDFAMTGSLEVDKGQKVVVDKSLEGESAVTVQFVSAEASEDLDEDASAEELEKAVSGENAALEITLDGSGQDSYEIDPGSYYLNVTVSKSGSGSAAISVQ